MSTHDQARKWVAPPLPANEDERLAALYALALLDTAPEEAFDALVRLAAHTCNVPIALVTLVDRDRLWFKANHGLTGLTEVPRAVGFCGHTVSTGAPMEVPDAARDERFRANPLVTGHPKIRFYAGFPIDDGQGHVLGCLCVIDRQPRELTAVQRGMLEDLSRIARRMLEWRRRGVETGTRIGRLLDQSDSEIFVLDPGTLRCLYANRGALANTGYTLQELQALEYFSLFPSLEREGFLRDLEALRSGARKRIDCEALCRRRDGSTYASRSNLQFHAESDPPVISMMSEDISERKRMEGELQAYVGGLTAVIAIQHDIATHTRDLDALMRLIVARAREITGAKGAVIGVMEGKELIYRMATDDALGELGQQLGGADGLSMLALRESRAMRCNETQVDPRVDREACNRLGVRSLVVAPFYQDGRPAGVLKAYSGDPHAFTDQSAQLVQLLASTLGGAIHRRAAEQAILEIARGASIDAGRDFFHTLSTQLAGLLAASHVFIGTRAGEGRELQLLAANQTPDRQALAHLPETLCQHALSGEAHVTAHGVQQRFPSDDLLPQLGAQAYVGVPLMAADRSPIGVIGALFEAPLEEPERVQSLLQIFASRVASELERQRSDGRLREQSGVLQSVLDSIAEGVIVANEEGQLVMLNPAARRMIGLALNEEVQVENLSAHYGFYRADGRTLFLPEELPIMQAVRGRATDAVEGVIRNASLPEGITVSAHGRPLVGPDGQARGGVVVLRDITRLKRSELEIRKLNQDLEGRVRERTAEVESANLELRARHRENELLNELARILQSCMTMAEGCEVLAKYAPQLFPDHAGALYLQAIERRAFEQRVSWGGDLHSDETFVQEQCWSLRRGQMHASDGGGAGLLCQHLTETGASALSTICLPLAAQGDTLGVLYLVREVKSPRTVRGAAESDRQLALTLAEQLALALANIQLRETLRNQSIRDPLTGAFNRRFLEESLRREFARAQRKESPLALLMVDIDHFKRYNDKHGHEAGDHVLQQMGKLFAQLIRESDIPCRYGGEEFLLVLPGASAEDALSRADKLLNEVRALKLSFQGQSLGRVTVSIGIAVYPIHGRTTEELFHAADNALYQAKESGRDRAILSGEKTRVRKRARG